MNILPIKGSTNFTKTSFKGYMVEDSKYGTTHLSEARRTGRREEKTVGNYHKDNGDRIKIYYADPLEYITDEIREKADYIFYDDEPAFPDIERQASKLYFFPPNDYDYSKYKFLEELDKFKSYFYRLEQADRKTVGKYEQMAWSGINSEDSRAKADYFKAHVADAQYNQETAHLCKEKFNEAGMLIDHKNELYRNMEQIKNQLENRTNDYNAAKNEIKQRSELNEILKTKIASLEGKKEAYEKINESLESTKSTNEIGLKSTKEAYNYNAEHYPSEHYTYLEILSKQQSVETYANVNKNLNNSVQKEEKEASVTAALLENVTKDIDTYKQQLKENTICLKKIESYFKELPEIIKNLNTKLAQKTEQFNVAKGKLMPYFDNLKNVLYTRGIKVIR